MGLPAVSSRCAWGGAALVFVVILAQGIVEQGTAFHVLDVEEARLFHAQVHEGGLQSRKDRVDHAFIDVAYQPGGVGPFVKNFAEAPILEDGDALFVRTYVDENFPLGAGNAAMGVSHSLLSLKYEPCFGSGSRKNKALMKVQKKCILPFRFFLKPG
jgi:hypothetical protein